jgi:ferric-dicitrate binding protein FerR (iron transport regulator)
MVVPKNITALIEKYQTGQLTTEEENLLNDWYHSFNDSQIDITDVENLTENQLAHRIKLRLDKTIKHQGKLKVATKSRRWKLIAAAASIVVMLSVGSYFIFSPQTIKKEIAKTDIPKPSPKNDIAPGGNRATLTLSDGSTIILDSASNGTISKQGNIKVEKLANGLLAYSQNGKQITENDEAFYNTITTPRGGQYHVTLSDGSQVWLNAASSIRFPVAFKGTERRVEVTGETYFEVAKNAAMPFKVKAGSSEIEVLGTHFNVNAYDDEANIKTTLLEGKVKVSVANQVTRFLQPGQQSAINKEGKIGVLDNANIEEVMAWKNGRFQFSGADLKSILRQISRWYNVDIVYNGNVNLHFTGQLTRNDNVSKVFEKLEMTGEVNFKIDDKKIIVSR